MYMYIYMYIYIYICASRALLLSQAGPFAARAFTVPPKSNEVGP